MPVTLLTDRINNKLEKSNLITEHALNREPLHPFKFESQFKWGFTKSQRWS